jgi:antitoxin component of MazEF toxin-antitoxin module
MIWQEHDVTDEGQTIYAKVEDDGKIRITAVKGYPELDAFLAWVEAGNDPSEFWTQNQLGEMEEI